MKQKILVLYYSQSGQLGEILDNVLADIRDEAEIDTAEIKPVKPFPFPWTSYTFFDAMPECVELIKSPVEPISTEILNKKYDLIVLGYQPWFLHPSQPTTSFLKSGFANILHNKPVVTVIGCRNMWLNGQERVKEMIAANGGKLVGNIVLEDTHPNLVSLLTVIRWAFKGQKEASGMLPDAGVQQDDINKASRFGKPILQHLQDNKLDQLQDHLNSIDAVKLKPGLIVLEKRGTKNFRKWAKYIREKGGPGDPNRRGRVKLFSRLLITAIFVLTPVSSLTAWIQLQMQKSQLKRDVKYFKGTDYQDGMI